MTNSDILRRTRRDTDVRNAATVSFGQGAVMVFGALLALLIARAFGKNSTTDAFFAAYGLYSVAVVFGQSLRLTAIPRLVAGDEREIDKLLAAVLLMGALGAIPLIALAGPLGELLVAGDASHVASESLRALWPAMAGQLLVGLLAAVSVVRGRFSVMAYGYFMTGFVNVAAFAALQSWLGIQAVSAALGASTILLVGLMLVVLLRDGWRPHPLHFTRLLEALKDSAHLIVTSASFLAANLGYVICVSVATRLGEGSPTVYAYAYLAGSLLVGTTAVSAAMVRGPALLADPGENDATVTPAHVVSTYRFTLLVIGPALGLAALVGKPVVEATLGDAFDGQDAERLVTTMLCLSGWVFASAASVLAAIELVHRGRLTALAMVAAGQTLALPLAAIAGREALGIEGIAIAQSLTLVAAAIAQLVIAFGREAPLVRVAGSTLRAVLVNAAAFGPAVALVAATGGGAAVAYSSLPVALALAVILSRVFWRDEFAVLLNIFSGRRERAAAH